MSRAKSRSQRKRGVVLSPQGWQRLQEAQHQFEAANNNGLPYTIEDLTELTQLSPNTLSKVRACKHPVDRKTLKAYFNTFGIDLTPSDYISPSPKPTADQTPLPTKISRPQQDWGEAIDVSIFHGRVEELATLGQWVRTDHCRLLCILGMGGIGKTALTVKLAQQLQQEFDFIIWRSLRNAPSLASLLGELVPFLSYQQPLETDIRLLLQCLQTARCLVVLDNIETILQPEQQTGYYRPGYEDYAELFRILGESQHQSCVLLTSREKPAEIAMFEGAELPVRSLTIGGALDMALALVKNQQLKGTAEEKQTLCESYGCSPLALKITASSIHDLFDSDIAQFLAEETIIFSGVRRLLNQQFERLSPLERLLMYWLAINREWTTTLDLKTDLIPTITTAHLLEALESLVSRCLIESRRGQYTQQPVVMEFVIRKLTQQISYELLSQDVSLCSQLAIVKAQAKDYLRDIQTGLILQPVLDQLLITLGNTQAIADHLTKLLDHLRHQPIVQAGYTPGNIINLLRQIGTDLSGYDLSHLPIWQANLQDISLHHVNFTASDLSQSLFTHTFGAVFAVALNPAQSLVAAADANGNIYLWQISNGQQLLALKGHTAWISSIAFSPNGDRLASGSFDHTLRIWDIDTGQCLNTLVGHQDAIWSVAFSREGDVIASCSSDQTIRLWNLVEGRCLNVLQGHDAPVHSVAFSPQHPYLASSSADSTIKLWDLKTGECINTFQGHNETVWSVAFSPTSPYLASGSNDKTMRLWDIQSGQCLMCLSGHSNAIVSVDFSADGQTLASGSQDNTIRLWDISSGHCVACFTDHTSWVWSVAFAHSSNLLASGSQDRSVRLWNIAKGKCFRTFSGFTNTVWSLVFTPEGNQLISGSQDGWIRFWDTQRGDCLQAHQQDGFVSTVAISPDGHLLASGGYAQDNKLKIWDLDNNRLYSNLPVSFDVTRAITFSPNGNLLACTSDLGDLQLWDVNAGLCTQRLQGHSNAIWSVAFSPDGCLLASGGMDQTLRLWQVENGSCCEVFEYSGWVGELAFSPQGDLLASFSAGEPVVILQPLSDLQCRHKLTGHLNVISAIDFSQDGTLLASCSFDQTIRIWDIQTGQCLQICRGHTSSVWSVVFSPCGQMVVSGGSDETIKFWNIHTGECLRTVHLPGPYEGMNITGITGVTHAQKTTLKALGAIEDYSRHEA